MEQIIILIIQLALVVGGYLIGKYIMPNHGKQIQETIAFMSNWSTKFIRLANQYIEGTGEDKMNYVCTELQKIAEKNGIKMTTEQIKAIIQDAYDAIKYGENDGTPTLNKNK